MNLSIVNDKDKITEIIKNIGSCKINNTVKTRNKTLRYTSS